MISEIKDSMFIDDGKNVGRGSGVRWTDNLLKMGKYLNAVICE